MELKFENTTWQKEQNGKQLMVSYMATIIGSIIDLHIVQGEKMELSLSIKKKRRLKKFP